MSEPENVAVDLADLTFDLSRVTFRAAMIYSDATGEILGQYKINEAGEYVPITFDEFIEITGLTPEPEQP